MATEYLDKAGATLLVQKIKNELGQKVDAESGKVLSTNDYTSAEKTKLLGVEDFSQVNVIETVKVNNTALTPSSKAVNITVPTSVSELVNDSDYQTSSQVNSAISDAIGNVTSIQYSKVSSLPSTGVAGTIYLISNSHGVQDVYDEYIYLSDSKTFEKIGSTDIDLSGYVKSSDLTAITTSELEAMWSAS